MVDGFKTESSQKRVYIQDYLWQCSCMWIMPAARTLFNCAACFYLYHRSHQKWNNKNNKIVKWKCNKQHSEVLHVNLINLEHFILLFFTHINAGWIAWVCYGFLVIKHLLSSTLSHTMLIFIPVSFDMIVN